MFILGFLVDTCITIFTPMITSELLFGVRRIISILGSIIIALGIATIFNANLGMTPNDAISLVIASKSKFEYRWVRIAYYFALVIIGIFLGGVFGLGTILCAILRGPVSQFFMPKAKIVLDFFTKSTKGINDNSSLG